LPPCSRSVACFLLPLFTAAAAAAAAAAAGMLFTVPYFLSDLVDKDKFITWLFTAAEVRA
jgi:hypothetical protein